MRFPPRPSQKTRSSPFTCPLATPRGWQTPRETRSSSREQKMTPRPELWPSPLNACMQAMFSATAAIIATSTSNCGRHWRTSNRVTCQAAQVKGNENKTEVGCA